MTFLLRNRLEVVILTVVLSTLVLPQDLAAQTRIRWTGDRPLAPYRSLQAPTAPDTVRLLALMVEFQEDNDQQTQGSGKFDTTAFAGRAIDPPPHDRFYFQSKVLFVQNYFRKVSNGKMTIMGDVLPSIVTVSKVMSAYTRDNEPSFRGLARLAVEAWSIADTAFPGTDLASYDGYVLFHAGAGKDIDLVGLFGYDPYPYDVPSIYLSLEGMRKALDSTAFTGVSVRTGSHFITNTMILPETESRVIGSGSGGDTLMISINGLFAASVGSHLGLPDLFETGSGITAIGQHGLMDGASIFAYYGLFPPEPSAWEKMHLGWIDPIVIDRSALSLTAPAVSLTEVRDTVYKIPINDKEYFLVENRNRDPLGNGQKLTILRNGVSGILSIPKDSAFYFAFDFVNAVNGSVTDVEDFDWALIGFMTGEEAYTGGGILIWHIDESVIQGGIASNSINNDPDRRGVDLEEADGAQDIGQIYGQFGGGSGSEFGSPLDAWFDGNLAVIYRNAFDAASFPSSNANSGARSLVSIRGFSARSARMTFSVDHGGADIGSLPGFPKMVDGVPTSAVPFDADGDDATEFFTSRTLYSGPGTRDGTPIGRGALLGWSQDGSTFMNSSDSSGLIAEIRESEISAPVLFRLNAMRYAAAASPTSAYIWSLTDGDNDDRLDSVLTYPLIAAPAPWDVAAVDSFLIAYGSAGVNVFSITGREVFSASEPEIVASTGERAVIARGQGRSLRLTDLNGSFAESHRELDGMIVSMASGNSSGVQRMLSVLTEPTVGSHVVHLFRSLGTTIEPVGVFNPSRFLSSGESFAAPVIQSDVDADGEADVVLHTTAGRIFAFNRSGTILDGYPVEPQGVPSGAPLITRSSTTGGADLFSFDSSGTLKETRAGTISAIQLGDPGFPSGGLGIVRDGAASVLSLMSVQSSGRVGVWKLQRPATGADLLWPLSTGTASGSFAAEAVTPNPTPLASGLLPAARTYNWPNPVYDDVTYIRFYSEKDGAVTVDIFDLAGDKITRLSGSAVAGQDGEIAWDVSGIQSGVYLARIEIDAGGQTAQRIIKVAVIK